jgi:hypothetical protein
LQIIPLLLIFSLLTQQCFELVLGTGTEVDADADVDVSDADYADADVAVSDVNIKVSGHGTEDNFSDSCLLFCCLH